MTDMFCLLLVFRTNFIFFAAWAHWILADNSLKLKGVLKTSRRGSARECFRNFYRIKLARNGISEKIPEELKFQLVLIQCQYILLELKSKLVLIQCQYIFLEDRLRPHPSGISIAFFSYCRHCRDILPRRIASTFMGKRNTNVHGTCIHRHTDA